ncbi:MAG: galactose oxidase [Alphaproteobacteria bacterium]|nr:galactose oxidase [Alphaproteobacteria bacterium]
MNARTPTRREAIAGLASVLPVSCAPWPAGAKAGTTPQEGEWRPCADMPFAAQEIYPTLFERAGRPLIVNAGGLALGLTRPIKAATTIYDPEADEWSEGVDLPEERHHLALAAAGGGVHAIGGFTRRGLKTWVMQAQNWRIEDPTRGVWEALRPLPKPQAEAVTLVHGGRIHVIGGRSPIADANGDWGDHGDVGDHWSYDPETDEWSRRAPLPQGRNSAAGAATGDEIFVVSGRTVAAGNTPACHAYNANADAWREIAALPAPIRQPSPRGQGGIACAAYKGQLFVFGGEWFAGQGFGGGGVYADVWVYDPPTNEWRALAPMARPRHGLGGVAIEGRGSIDGVYAIGGALQRGGAGVTAYVDRFSV